MLEFDQERWEMCRLYYSRNVNVKNLSFKALRYSEGQIPDPDDYFKLTQNKYSIKLYDSFNSEPIHQRGDLVVIRKTITNSNPSFIKNIPPSLLAGQIALIVTPDYCYPRKATKKAKPYLVLPKGFAKMFVVEEKDLRVVRPNERFVPNL